MIGSLAHMLSERGTVSFKSSQGRILGPRLPALPLEDLSNLSLPSRLYCHHSSPGYLNSCWEKQQPLTWSRTAIHPPFPSSTRQPHPISDGHCRAIVYEARAVACAAPTDLTASSRPVLPTPPPIRAIPALWAVSSRKPGSCLRASQSASFSACSAPHPTSTPTVHPLILQTSV